MIDPKKDTPRKKAARKRRGRVLRTCREEMGLTQRGLAYQLGMKGPNAGGIVSRWETGGTNPADPTLAFLMHLHKFCRDGRARGVGVDGVPHGEVLWVPNPAAVEAGQARVKGGTNKPKALKQPLT